MSVKDIVDAALALERAGERQQSIALLERYKDKDTDIKGVLGGRLKRMWMESEQKEHGARALALYLEALAAAKTPDQIYYLAINVAFMKFAFVGDRDAAERWRHWRSITPTHQGMTCGRRRPWRRRIST